LDLGKSLDEGCDVPWVVLSAGVDIELFREQVRLACRGGASGFLGGRAIWKNAVRLPAEERRRFLATEGQENLRGLIEIAQKYARPWMERTTPGFRNQT